MSHLTRRVFVTVLCVATVLCVVTGLAWTASAQDQECLANLYQCDVCVQKSGGIDISGCQDEPPSGGEGIPPELLRAPDTGELVGVQKLVSDRILSHWHVLNAVFGDKNRIYIPREMYDLAGRFPGATAEEVLRAGVIKFQRSLIALASRNRVVRVPTGDGGEKIVIQSSDVLMSFVVRLLNDAGAFANVDLEDYVVPGERGLAPDVALPKDGLFELFERSLEVLE